MKKVLKKTMSKTLNLWILAAAVFTSASSFAVDVAGHFVYKMPSGELVIRNATLDVPPRGQGKVVLKYSSGSIDSDKFRHRTVNNRVIFEVLFLNPPGAPANTAMAMTGSYFRGSNGVLYFGDAYVKSHVGGLTDSLINEFEAFDFTAEGSNWSHSAGFEFDTISKVKESALSSPPSYSPSAQ
ncbi:MAG: hypothetical protein NTV34_05140 [Proteobacteria bacterium]|nr:hypothetical protein [Pseudomonadota bacterium]